MKWIKSSDQLPPKDADILIYIEGLMGIVGWCEDIKQYVDTECCRYNFGLDEEDFANQVSYWCEVPDLPRELLK